jgi:AraC-like DNA-binding protein
LAVGRDLTAASSATLDVLKASRTPPVMAGKWLRLERYHHAANRCEFRFSDRRLEIHRRTLAGTGVPALPETLLVAGLLAHLVALTGGVAVTLTLRDQTVPLAQLPETRFDGGDLVDFVISWTDVAERPPPAEPPAGDPATRLRALFAADIGWTWRLPAAARNLGFSPRSLQRHLTASGTRFSHILREARVAEAGRLLAGDRAGLAEIGYCCGYADQAHFQREFRLVTNLTPRAFRAIAHA